MKINKKVMIGLKIATIVIVFAGCTFSVYALYVRIYPKLAIVPAATKTTVKKTVSVASVPTTVKSSTPTTTSKTSSSTSSTSSKPTTTVTSTPATPGIVTVPDSSVNTLTPTSSPSPSTMSYTSNNWSGYIATGQSYNAISATWTIPAVTGSGTSDSGDGTWIGIGGVTSADLIQIGTTNSVNSSGAVTTSAFYEILPQSSRTIPALTISPGDSITASLNEATAGQWTITISDSTTSQTYTNTISYTSSTSSAEWIEEDPGYLSGGQVPFDEFGSVSFTNGSVTSGSTGYTISASNPSPVTLENSSGQVLASPSAIGSDGESFTVTRSN